MWCALPLAGYTGKNYRDFENGDARPVLVQYKETAEEMRAFLVQTASEVSVEPRQFTDAEQLAALLRPLSDSDRAHAREILEKLSTHLPKRETPKRKRVRK
jgi:hypothetical protein